MTNAAIDWSRIDTVLLDMDGTLLDLRFDNWFWQELIPARFAHAQKLGLEEARRQLEPRFLASRGSLDWYCIEHWTRELGLDVAALKRDSLRRVCYLAAAEDFLLRLRGTGKRCVLVTNAHPLTLALKDEQVGLTVHFDAVYSTHAFGAPKEDVAFWPRLQHAEPFEAARTLLVDDNLTVLAAAQRFGLKWLCAIRMPDSGRPPQTTGRYPAVDRVGDLLA